MHHGVQERSHSSGHFKQFQHCNENQTLVSRAVKYFKQNLRSYRDGLHLSGSVHKGGELIASRQGPQNIGTSRHQLMLRTSVTQTKARRTLACPSRRHLSSEAQVLILPSPPLPALVWYRYKRSMVPGLNQRPSEGATGNTQEPPPSSSLNWPFCSLISKQLSN